MITVTKGQWFPLTFGNISYAGAAFDLQGATEVSASLVSTLGVMSALSFEVTAYNEPAEHFLQSTFLLRFIIHGAIPPFSAAACKGDVTPQSLGKAGPQRKTPGVGPGLSFLTDGERTEIGF